jgi:FtsP/CotA-like multicopper oxidase with cupredoxin domain
MLSRVETEENHHHLAIPRHLTQGGELLESTRTLLTTELHSWLSAIGVLAALWGGTTTAPAQIATAPAAEPSSSNNLADPPVFASKNGVLDIMMVALPQPIETITYAPPDGSGAIHPTGWVYQICPRPASGLSCPAGSSTVAPYGGTRLALMPGDLLKVRFVNRLPKINPLKLRHELDPGGANLFLNPSNLHTHGLLTPARAPTRGNPTFGDYIFVQIFNSENGIPEPQSAHQHGPIVMDTADYAITIPPNHPSGLFWFHPHVHGITLNQVVSGMSGLITIGNIGDNVHGDVGASAWPGANVRHIMLKEIQVLPKGVQGFDSGPQPVANGEVLNQEDPDFCQQFPNPGEVRDGSCPGQNLAEEGGNDYTGGKWYLTVNGQQFPIIPVTEPDGEIWRVGTGAGNLSWDLQLVDDQTHQPMTVQLVAIDGVAVHLPQDTTMSTMVQLGGGRFKVVPCPNAQVIGSVVPACVNEIVMMPSSRTEFWVTYRNANGVVVPPPPGASATWKMVGLTMGSGDSWPAVDLAKVQFAPSGPRQITANQLVVAGATDAKSLYDAPAGILTTRPVPGANAGPPPANCSPLAAGHRRRIFFGFSDVTVNNTFALGYEEVDQNGNVVPGSQLPAPDMLAQFDPSVVTVCLPLGPGQSPVTEQWELIQLSTENHNFHLHQTRFTMLGTNGGVVQDNFPMGVSTPDATIADTVNNHQNGVCTVPQWRSGHCATSPQVVSIQFTQLGEFVYHCHILEHEDGGMMARIMVVPSPQ